MKLVISLILAFFLVVNAMWSRMTLYSYAYSGSEYGTPVGFITFSLLTILLLTLLMRRLYPRTYNVNTRLLYPLAGITLWSMVSFFFLDTRMLANYKLSLWSIAFIVFVLSSCWNKDIIAFAFRIALPVYAFLALFLYPENDAILMSNIYLLLWGAFLLESSNNYFIFSMLLLFSFVSYQLHSAGAALASAFSALLLIFSTQYSRLRYLFFCAFPIGAFFIVRRPSINSFQDRFFMWEAAIKEIFASPLFGNGLGMTATNGKSVFPHAHNFFLTMLNELGAIGICLFAYFIFQLWKSSTATHIRHVAFLAGLLLWSCYDEPLSWFGAIIPFSIIISTLDEKKVQHLL